MPSGSLALFHASGTDIRRGDMIGRACALPIVRACARQRLEIAFRRDAAETLRKRAGMIGDVVIVDGGAVRVPAGRSRSLKKRHAADGTCTAGGLANGVRARPD